MSDASTTTASSSTDAPTQGGNDTSGATPTAGDAFTPITTQDDLNRVIGSRVQRVREQFADYDDLKTRAGRVDELETQIQEHKTAAEAVTGQVPGLVATALRTHLVDLHGIDADDADLFLTATEPDLLLKQVTRLVARQGAQRTTGNVVPREGSTPTATEDPNRAWARSVFGGSTTA